MVPPAEPLVGSAPSVGPGAPGGAGPRPGEVASLLEQLLRRSGTDDAASRARQVAYWLQPVLVSMGQVRQQVGEQHGDALVHHRCLLRLRGPAPAASSDLEEPGRLRTRVQVRGSRAGWELLHASTCWAAAGPQPPQVVHELARRREGQAAVVTAPRPSAAPAVSSSQRLVLVPLDLTDVRAWAQASGDHNLLHLQPGWAQRLGLAAGEREVVAHGLLLAALSLAVVLPHEQAADLRFLRPLPLAAGVPAQVGVDPAGGVWGAGQRLLRRRDGGAAPGSGAGGPALAVGQDAAARCAYTQPSI